MERFLRPRSIRYHLVAMNVVLLGVLFPSASVWFIREQAAFRDVQLQQTIEQSRHSLERRSASLARSIALSAGQAVSGYDFTTLGLMLGRVARGDPEILACMVMDSERRVAMHSDPTMVGARLDTQDDLQAAEFMHQAFPSEKPPGGELAPVRFLHGTGALPVMEAVAPVYSGTALWGVLRCSFSLATLAEETQVARRQWTDQMRSSTWQLATVTLVFLSLGGVIAVRFTRPFTRALHSLSEGVGRVARGDLEHEILPGALRFDEFKRLSRAFNRMTRDLRGSQRQVEEYSRSLEEKVLERTKELEQAHFLLVQQAHEAGMAEMAVGVLHNIGNAITPAKVGASMLAKQLRGSPLRTHLGGWAEQAKLSLGAGSQLNAEERDRMLKLLDLLPRELAEEYDRAIAEVESIQRKHDHIESIIGLQMRYARLVGETEEVDLERVVEDALQLLDEFLFKRAIRVTKQFAPMSKVRIEEPKVLQVVVNLIKNAAEAMEWTPESDRELDLVLGPVKGANGGVELIVRDRGIGFSGNPERLFQFGYSTKSTGSGFGLHSCANYLAANSGSITARSDGEGAGAEFTVRLATGGTKPGMAGAAEGSASKGRKEQSS